MNAVTSIWRQLVRRRLWPVAILLLAALAAVPVLLAREPEVPVLPPDPATATAGKVDDTIAEPVVAEVTPEDRSRRRRVLGAVKDPFRPAPVKKPKADKAQAEAPQVKTPGVPSAEPSSGLSPGSGSGSGIGSGGVSTPVVTEPAPKKKYYSAGTIIVRFGQSSMEKLDRFAVRKLEPVPDDELPLLIYMGLTKNGKKAKFLIDASIEVDGDGVCKPHPASCETIELAVGETEFLDVIDPEAAEDASADVRILEQFQLDLVDIKRAGDADVK
jgi:hypothetical protein